ncbi:hypothetical protein HYU10_04200 [Candidatus Woesearchaeota archaeon]|nr:hypothetical protein [Candidatus Woesearchaeota archaeon]
MGELERIAANRIMMLKGDNSARGHLPEEIFEGIEEHAQQFVGLTGYEKALGYLEDSLAHINNHLSTALFGDEINKEFFSQLIPYYVIVNQFFNVALLRYIQIKTGKPKLVQLLNCYDVPEGNQVDIFLVRHFGVRIPED